ncbi:MAG TPA: plastocyanin/azurin family copper-binding protein [Longimicrobiaceae bacterium]
MMSRPFVISLAAALLLSLGCSGDGGYGGDGGDGGNGGPTGPQNNGRLEGEVTGPGGGIPGAEVAIEGGGSTETDEDGSYSISNVAPGTKTVTVTPPDGFTLAPGETASKTVNVVANAAATLNWSLRLEDTNPTAVEIGLTANRFSPDDVVIPVGSTVTWVNETSTTHTISPNDPGQSGTWPEQTISGEGTEYQHTFSTAGTFDYVCKLHAGMTGVVRVH